MSNKTNGSVIVIEDELPAIMRLQSLLQTEYECRFSRTGQAGLSLYQKIMDQNPLVICDVNLPDMVGFDVCSAIKSQNPATYVMLFTAYNDSELRMEGLNAYADSYVDKTISDEEIKLKIRNAFNTIYLKQTVEPPPVVKQQSSCKFDNVESQTRKLLQDYYKQPIAERHEQVCGLEAISKYFHQSPRTFQRKMHDQVGMPFKTFQLIVRLKMSRSLLMDGFSVTQIAEILEFSSPSHYSRAFQQQFEVTPSKYKKYQPTQ